MSRLGHPRIVLIAAVLYLFSGAAYADPIIITSGSAGLHNPGDRSGILLVGQDTRLIGDGFGAVMLVARPGADPVPALRARGGGVRLPGDR